MDGLVGWAVVGWVVGWVGGWGLGFALSFKVDLDKSRSRIN